MAKLYFRYGPMNSGKSTRLLQDAHNYEERNQRVAIMKPTIDTKDEEVLSRLNIKRRVDIPVTPSDNTLELIKNHIDLIPEPLSCVLVDEAQFLTKEQIDGLFRVTLDYKIPVICYGIRTDFMTNAFEGSLRLLEIAHSLDEMKTICFCGKKAMFNARKSNGKFIKNGPQVAIDGDKVTYESLCGDCYNEHIGF